jgi:7-cyano-7-deazaguanine synthase
MDYILVYSGGLDSTVLLYDLLDSGYKVGALSVDYGQRHSCELQAAALICKQRNVEHKIVHLPSLAQLFGSSSLTDRSVAVPEGHYSEETMKSTVVPNRNMLLLSLAGAWAMASKAQAIAYAAHGSDHAVYPDCRPEFVKALGMALSLADWHSVKLECPYSEMTKADIVQKGTALCVPFEQTWSCYNGMQQHCGKCGTCVARIEAFADGGIIDPTTYQT